MAIKLPDPGNGIPEQRTGNDEWTNMKIVRDNFADRSNAASRLVGTSTGNVMEVGAFGLGARGAFYVEGKGEGLNASNTLSTGIRGSLAHYSHIVPTLTGPNITLGNSSFYNVLSLAHYVDSSVAYAMHRFTLANHNIYLQHMYRPSSAENPYTTEWSAGVMLYTSGNTTLDSNKNLKTSSPVVRVFADHLDKIHEANDLSIEYVRNGVGDYTIKGTTGLRENDWQIVIPEDDHRNQLIAFTIEDDNGTIRLKTYKRTFNMTTFMFEPDLNTPLDIPEGRWVDLHFNDLPQEQLDEPVI